MWLLGFDFSSCFPYNVIRIATSLTSNEYEICLTIKIHSVFFILHEFNESSLHLSQPMGAIQFTPKKRVVLC